MGEVSRELFGYFPAIFGRQKISKEQQKLYLLIIELTTRLRGAHIFSLSWPPPPASRPPYSLHFGLELDPSPR